MKIENKKQLIKLLQIPSTEINILENLKNYTSFKLRDQCCYILLKCHTHYSLLSVLKTLKFNQAFSCKSLSSKQQNLNKFFVLGNGSNVIFNGYYNGVVITLGKHFKKIKIVKKNKNGAIIEVGAGVNLFVLNHFFKDNGLGGMEWCYGIPGSVGGAVFMNAGAFNHDMSEHVLEVKILKNGKFEWTKNFKFAYRNSSFQENNNIIVAVRFYLKISNKEQVYSLQKEYLQKRLITQPHEVPSAGSVFKRLKKENEIIYPAKLIDNLSLKGVKIRGAEVSTKHAGFIVNVNNASYKDVLELISIVSNKVKEHFNIELEPEIKIIN